MLCVLCLIVLWGFPLVTSYSGLKDRFLISYSYPSIFIDADSELVLGAHMAGHEAGEIIQGIAIALKAGAKKTDLDHCIGIHPTTAEEFVTLREPSRTIRAKA